MPDINTKIAKFPRAYDIFLVDAALHIMYTLEDDDVTFDEAVTATLSKCEWAVTDKGIDLILSESSRVPSSRTSASVPEGMQRIMSAAAALRADVIHETVVECGIDPDLFS